MNIGEKIAELRRDAGMTQEVLASRLVISPQAVSKWERGIANPDLEGELEDARSTAEEALDEVEDLKSELEALRGQMENGD